MRPTLPAWLAEASGSASSSGRDGPGPASTSSSRAAGEAAEAAGRPPPDAAAREASREAGRKIARAFAASAEELDIPPGQVPKPYTVPPGYKAPTMGEQFRYAALKHPYARLGYAGAFLLGLLGWAVASQEKKHPEHFHAGSSHRGAAAGSPKGQGS